MKFAAGWGECSSAALPLRLHPTPSRITLRAMPADPPPPGEGEEESSPMSRTSNTISAHERDRWLRHDAHRWIRHDVKRFLAPGTDPADVYPAGAAARQGRGRIQSADRERLPPDRRDAQRGGIDQGRHGAAAAGRANQIQPEPAARARRQSARRAVDGSQRGRGHGCGPEPRRGPDTGHGSRAADGQCRTRRRQRIERTRRSV
jgi:hypothetical protein